MFCKKEACNFIKKETLAQEFSCEFSEISKNTFSYRTPPVAASEGSLGFANKKVVNFEHVIVGWIAFLTPWYV